MSNIAMLYSFFAYNECDTDVEVSVSYFPPGERDRWTSEIVHPGSRKLICISDSQLFLSKARSPPNDRYIWGAFEHTLTTSEHTHVFSCHCDWLNCPDKWSAPCSRQEPD